MKVLVADKFEQSGLDGLAAAGFDVVSRPELKEDALREAIAAESAVGLIVRSTQVTANMMNGSLKLIVRAGAGYNTIDVAAATEKGIQVANCPGKNARAVAELAFGLILSLDRRIPDNVIALREGKWDKKGFGQARGLNGRTLGLIGLGNIGKVMIEIAKAFGMNVVAFSRHTGPAEAEKLGIKLVQSPEDLAAMSDIVSVHTSLSSETRGLLGKTFFENMRSGAYFVNTSRAEVVDQSELEKAIAEKGIRAGLDVFDDEPNTPTGEYTGTLKNNKNVYCTHHIGASTEEAQEAVASETVRIFEEYAKTGKAPNCVNA